ncbi:MAG: hypothetical protein GY841_10165 [FCB group bacterium]|nr:hypothetical protein [FCB group bacterium]
MDDYFTIDGGSFGVSGNELLVVDTAGYFEFTGSDVGINTGGAPGHPLTIALSGDYLSIVDSGDSDNDRVRLGESAGNGGYLTLYDDSEAVGALIRSYASADVQAYFNAGGVSIGSTSAPRTNYGLDVASGSLSAVFGADSNAFGTRTNSTSKRMRVGCYHYTNAQEPMAIIYANADSALNSLFIGGGTSLMNAATTIRLYTAANVTTTTGTERMRIESDGKIGMNGTTSPSTALDIGGGAMEYEEMSAPGAGAANTVRTYAVDDGGVSTFGIVNSTGDTVTLNDDALKTTEESFDISVDGENLIEIQEGTPDYVRILNDQPIQFTKVSASSASITICAGGSVSAGVVYNAMVEDTTTNTVQNNNGFISSASSVDLFNDGAGNEYALTLGAGGGLTMTRSAGAHTFNVFLSTFWI